MKNIDIVAFNIDGRTIGKNELCTIEDDSDLLVRICTDDGGILIVDITMFGKVADPAVDIQIYEDSEIAVIYQKEMLAIPKRELPYWLLQIFNKKNCDGFH